MRTMTMIGLMALAGCSTQQEPAANATANTADVAVIGGTAPAGPPPPLGTVDLGQPLRAFGTEPGWSLDVTPGVITYTDYSAEDPKAETFMPAIPAVAGGKAVWRTRNTAGEAVVLTLTLKDCLEAGEEDMTQPLTAEFKMGGTTRTGCAGPKPEGEAGVDAENSDDE
jgi:uncharacterized membrane protein